MARTISRWVLFGVAILSACISPPTTRLCSTGIYCPEDKQCGAVQAVCLDNPCGNGLVESGEQCDDGNILPGDGCSPSCQIETCGNGTLDPGETCDDGNTKGGDGCSKDCLSLEKCGNGIVDTDAGEICDDGNTVDGDGCNKTCTSTEVCGNHIVDREVGEVCDPPNVGGCSSDCRSTGDCGNGIIDADKGEECDDGLADNGDDKDCRSDCVINRCGDGRANTHGSHHEDCDGGGPVLDHDRTAIPKETAACNIDCTTPVCGDGKVNRSFKPNGVDGEQCDNIDPTTKASLNADDADCTASCLLSVCGDHLLNTVGPAHKEICDDGNRIDTDSCTNACTDKACGDGIVDPAAGEECDLGSDTNGTSKNIATSACPGCLLARCGDNKVEAGVEECDGTPNCSATCRIKQCGNGIIDPGEECDKGILNDDNGDCRTDCIINRCGDGFLNMHGANPEACEGLPAVGHGSHTVTPTETPNCNINCTLPTCGDTVVNRQSVVVVGPPVLTEQCDPPSAANHCSTNCQFERCGNGIVDPGEQCDSTPGCSSTCFLQVCGNGIVDPGEECDNGAANSDNADCRLDCVINRCGDGHINTSAGAHHEECDGGPLAIAHDRTAIPTNTVDCNSNCKAPRCGDGLVNPLFVAQPVPPTTPANTLPEQCDPPGPGCSAICRLENCGNGVKDPGEQCDDGNGIDGDGCENDCTLPRCGNGIPDIGEECDDGNSSNADDCTSDCKFARCGDGFLRTILTTPTPPTIVEECDTAIGPTSCAYDPDLQPCNVCVLCVLTPKVAPFCGDGHTDDPFESCDDGNTTCGSCSTDCQTTTLQASTGLIFAAAANDYRASGDTFTLTDGIDTKTFEITKGTATGTNILIQVSAGELNAAVAGKIATKISGALQITATPVGGAVTLTDVVQTVRGDVPIVSTVGTANFAVIGMGGSQGGNCASGQRCTQSIDCASHVCTIAAGDIVGACAP